MTENSNVRAVDFSKQRGTAIRVEFDEPIDHNPNVLGKYIRDSFFKGFIVRELSVKPGPVIVCSSYNASIRKDNGWCIEGVDDTNDKVAIAREFFHLCG